MTLTYFFYVLTSLLVTHLNNLQSFCITPRYCNRYYKVHKGLFKLVSARAIKISMTRSSA